MVNSLVACIPNLESSTVLSPYPSKFSTYASIGYDCLNFDSTTSLIILLVVAY